MCLDIGEEGLTDQQEILTEAGDSNALLEDTSSQSSLGRGEVSSEVLSLHNGDVSQAWFTTKDDKKFLQNKGTSYKFFTQSTEKI